MRYAKPEITSLGNPAQLVRNHKVKNIQNCLDSDGSGNRNATCNAYEADE